MKKIFLFLAFCSTALFQNGFAQDADSTPTEKVLIIYYQLKDALVAGNAETATVRATELTKTLTKTTISALNDKAREALIKDAKAVAQAKNIDGQRENFGFLSEKMFELAKKVKLSAEPVYQQFCPMKKASWLSDSKTIKNPYFGNAMLSCGTIKATL